ncbi:GGDEF domain-containing protein [Mycoplasma sp. 4423]
MKSKQKLWFFITSGILLFILIIVLLVVFINLQPQKWHLVLIVIALFFSLILITLILYFAIINFAKSRELVKHSFNRFVEKIITNNSIGLIIYDTSAEVIWISEFIKNNFHNDFIGLKITDAIEKIDASVKGKIKYNNSENIILQNNNNYYEAQFWPLDNTVVIRDTTIKTLYKKELHEQKPVIGELEIDNYSHYQSVFSEEQLFKINKVIIDALNESVEKYNLIYRQYTNGKFIILTNELSLTKLKETNFEIFTKINDRLIDKEVTKLSVSLGLAVGWSSLETKLSQAKKALVQAQSRGGDQVAIFSDISKPQYFGSYTEIFANKNRTRISGLAQIIANKLSDDKIKNVVIYGHKWADLDAIGSAYGIYTIAKAFQKDAYISITTMDNTTKNFLQATKKNNLFIKSTQANNLTSEDSLVFLVDNSDPERTDNIDALVNTNRDNVFVLDHHRLGKTIDFCPKSNLYVDTTASSASEIVTEILMFLSYKVDVNKEVAQWLLNGIYLDTSQFSKSASKRAFEAAAWLESKGAEPNISGELLKYDDETVKKVKALLENILEIKDGYYLAYSNQEATNDVISIAANEVLKVRGRRASFVVGKLPNSKRYKLSARGIDTNVQVIAEMVGGGGHFTTAAAESEEDLETFANNIRHAITVAERT